MKLIIENVRSFAGHHELDVRPLTLLVGENSSGKSTCLAALAAVSDAKLFPSATGLNKAPYDLGTFDTTATFKGGKAGRAKSFSLGYKVQPQKSDHEVEVVATYCSEDGEARLQTLQFVDGAVKASLTWEKGKLLPA